MYACYESIFFHLTCIFLVKDLINLLLSINQKHSPKYEIKNETIKSNGGKFTLERERERERERCYMYVSIPYLLLSVPLKKKYNWIVRYSILYKRQGRKWVYLVKGYCSKLARTFFLSYNISRHVSYGYTKHIRYRLFAHGYDLLNKHILLHLNSLM